MTRKLAVACIALFVATAALASFYDDYDAGLTAVRKGQWQVVVQKMSAAIKANPNENDHAKTYGAIFINYHPYYYRGVAYMNLGNYDAAIADFEKTSGPGEVNQGQLETLMARAKQKQSEVNEAPAPVPAPQPAVQPQPRVVPAPVPASPSIDPALRQQVAAAINAANASLANNRKAAGTPQYQQAMAALAEANQRSGTAKTDDDLHAAMASANTAKMYADNAVVAPTVATATTPPTKVQVATQLAVGDVTQRVRKALESYFNGEFADATSQFKRLAENDLRNNGWIYAFLGASQYSMYAFEADEDYKQQAIQSFRKAKQLRFKRGGLPDKYFSKRIRKAFNDYAG